MKYSSPRLLGNIIGAFLLFSFVLSPSAYAQSSPTPPEQNQLASVLSALQGTLLRLESALSSLIPSRSQGLAAVSASLSQGLVGYWKFDEGSGTTAADASGSGNTGTLQNGPAWVDGKLGKALSFDGSNDYVTIPHNANQLLTGGFTLSAWIKPITTGRGQTGRVIEKATDAVATGGYVFRISGSSPTAMAMRMIVNNGTSRDSGTFNSSSIWTHILVTVAADATVTHYINGVQSGTPGTTGALSGITTTNPLLIGDSVVGSRTFNGSLDDVRVYNRALSPSEIQELYTVGNEVISLAPTPSPTPNPTPTPSPTPSPTPTPTPTPNPAPAPNPTDTTPPVMSNITSLGISSSVIRVTWTTNEISDSQIEYGPSNTYGLSTTLDSALTKNHIAILTGLNPGTIYHYRVKSSDTAKNQAVSQDMLSSTQQEVSDVIVQSVRPTWPSPNTNLDRWGGDTRLKSPSGINQEITFVGQATSITANTMTDASANFPVDGRLVGKLMSPNYRTRRGTRADQWWRIVSNTKITITADTSGGGDFTGYALVGDPYMITGTFQLEKIGDRWWFIDPEGNAFFPIAVSGTNDSANTGNPRKFDALYLQQADSIFTSDLSAAGLNSFASDVVNANSVTAQAAGDTIYIGSFIPFNVTYFNATRLGSGGAIKWYYSTPSGWKLINSNGNPAKGSTAQNSDGGYNLDTGNYYGLGPDGLPSITVREANLIYWFTYKSNKIGGFATSILPDDFSAVAIPADNVHKFYIKGVVTVPFVTAPIFTQIFDMPNQSDITYMKYPVPAGTGDYAQLEWARAINQRYQNWGFNATGQYSYRYWSTGPYAEPDSRMPIEPTNTLSGVAMDSRVYSSPVKNLYEKIQCPAGSSNFRWQGIQADVFEPEYKLRIAKAAENIKPNPWAFLQIPEEADTIFGINSTDHDHLGAIVLMQNPYHPSGKDLAGKAVTFTDSKVYAKYALRDFLRYQYRTANENIAPFAIDSQAPFYSYRQNPTGDELTSLQSLNAAWGTYYTTWGTSNGDLNTGTNNYSTGTGFMDEDGKMFNTCKITYDQFQKAGFPKVKDDLDGFVSLLTARYGSIVANTVRPRTPNLLAYPLYQAPDIVLKAIQPYADLMWSSASSVSEVQRIYDALKKPIFNTDYMTADFDSPLTFGGTITSVAYDPATQRTSVSWTGRPHEFRRPWDFDFPQSNTFVTNPGACKYLNRTGHILAAHWNTVEFANNYTGCVKVGETIRILTAGKTRNSETQELRARSMQQKIDEFLDATGSDGAHFVAGWEHWSFRDFPLWDGVEHANFGLVTARDNAYDGYEARRYIAKDSNGRYVGGEDADYGNLLGPLSVYLSGLYDRLISGTMPSTDTTPPSVPTGLTGSAVSSSQINLSWTASTDNVGVAGYKLYRCQGIGCTSATQIATVTSGTSYSNAGLSASTTYVYAISAYDASSNTSAKSSFVSVTTLSLSSDTTPPSVLVTSPLRDSTVSGAVSVSATASDNVGVAGVQFKLDGINLGTEDTTTPYSVIWDTTKSSNGSHVLTAIARDAAANQTTSKSLSVVISNVTPPTDTIPPTRSSGLPSGSLPAGAASATLSLTTNESALCKYGTTAHMPFATLSNSFSATGGTAHTQSLTGLQNGQSYNYVVRCKDIAGNANTDDYMISFSIATLPTSGGGGSSGGGGGGGTSPSPSPTPPPSAISPLPLLTRTLYRGIKNTEVTTLQKFLITKNYLAPGNATGYFGSATFNALKHYQCERILVCSGNEFSTGYGGVGLRTRALINQEMGGGTTSLTPPSTPDNEVARQTLIIQLREQIKQLQIKLLELQIKLLQERLQSINL